jgi:hypothetical protein
MLLWVVSESSCDHDLAVSHCEIQAGGDVVVLIMRIHSRRGPSSLLSVLNFIGEMHQNSDGLSESLFDLLDRVISMHILTRQTVNKQGAGVLRVSGALNDAVGLQGQPSQKLALDFGEIGNTSIVHKHESTKLEWVACGKKTIGVRKSTGTFWDSIFSRTSWFQQLVIQEMQL